jgi:RNA polymerase sigma-70 factor (ECF subfamily)
VDYSYKVLEGCEPEIHLLLFNIIMIAGGKKVSDDSREAYAALYEQYMPKVYRYISFRIRDEHMAQDLTSIVFEKALTKFDGFNPQKASFSTWIFTIARNTVIDHYRVYKKDEYLNSEKITNTPADYPSPEDEAIKTENTHRLRVFLARLNKREQEAIILKYSNGMSNREIAEVLNLTETNVGSILCRTIRKLRNSFIEWQNE